MADRKDIVEAAARICAGEVVAFPTETVYGLGANALDGRAVAKIFALKSRPAFNPLIVHVHTLAQAERYATLNARTHILAECFWPGSLTLVLPKKEQGAISSLATAGLDSVAIRIPANETALHLLAETGLPICAPSANRSGRISPTSAEHVRNEFKEQCPFLIDGGACVVGLESTVLDLTKEVPVLLRPGAVTQAMLEQVLRTTIVAAQKEGEGIVAPGMLASHYAPLLPMRLNADTVQDNEALLAFGKDILTGAAHTLNLSQSGNLQEAAANLFRYMRLLDNPAYACIAVMPVPNEGIGVAINDRLLRAACR